MEPVKAAECEDKEVCKPLKECEREMEFFKKREFAKLRVCGIFDQTMSHCCQIQSTDRFLEDSTSLVTEAVSEIETHKNFHLINEASCGAQTNYRIIGGRKARIHEFPWLVLLAYRHDDIVSFSCGGTLISKRYVLTAAHCVNQRDYNLFSVRIGEHTISKDIDCNNYKDNSTCSDLPVEDIEIESIISHKDFNNENMINDIALIRLSRDVELSKKRINVRTICLPVEESQQIDNIHDEFLNLTIAGWGLTENDRKQSDVLIKAKVPYLSNPSCIKIYDIKKRNYSTLKIEIKDSHMCAGGIERVDTCRGDSGSALMGVADLGNFSRIFQHGIVSMGVKCSQVEPFPGIYTRVSKFITWILDNMTP
ncbi:CLUMA_CG019129, isoform A [Clunio marinus]|uniref:CLUMA_CG019129, isoform A n=1 Tax=Clunio marinus TaxID=568069 RepID=A0A1J1J0C7_9DIPT|nr:CLUMA_CG019129, isoform A [Clunio marinus]